MKFSNLFEKLGIIFNLIVDSNIFTCLIFLVVGILLLRLNKKINNKKMGILIYLLEMLSLGIVFYENKNFIIDIGNKIIDSIFLNFYFPSIYVYLFILIISIILFLYTLINPIISKIYKIITNTYFLTLNFIFVLLISVISKNNIDVFTKESLFTNNNALVLLELSTLLFFIYIVINGLVYITNSLIIMVGNRIVTNEKYNNELTIEVPIEEEKSSEEVVDNKKVAVSFQELVKNIGNLEPIPVVANVASIEFLENIKPILEPETTIETVESKEETIEEIETTIEIEDNIDIIENTIEFEEKNDGLELIEENVEIETIQENVGTIEEVENIETIEEIENNKINEEIETTIEIEETIENIEQLEEKVLPKINLVPELMMVEDANISLELGKEFKFVDPTLLEEPFANNVIEINSSDNLKEKLNFIDFSILEIKDEESLTLNDYKLFSTMLKTVIQNNNNSNITISDILNESLSSKYSFEEYSKFEKILNSSLN